MASCRDVSFSVCVCLSARFYGYINAYTSMNLEMFLYKHVMMSSSPRSSLCHPSYTTSTIEMCWHRVLLSAHDTCRPLAKDECTKTTLLVINFFQERQQNSRRFPVVVDSLTLASVEDMTGDSVFKCKNFSLLKKTSSFSLMY